MVLPTPHAAAGSTAKATGGTNSETMPATPAIAKLATEVCLLASSAISRYPACIQ
jgi:hypothetical protein